jgi:phospholipid transport system transporter-binding protein
MTFDACAPAAPADGGFQPQDEGAHWIGTGTLTSANAGKVLDAAVALPLPTGGVVDCAGIAVVDSAAVAVLLALKRRADEAGRPLAFTNLPPTLRALAELYGVEEFLAPS